MVAAQLDTGYLHFVAEQIRKHMERCGFRSDAELARAAGLSPSRLSDILRSKPGLNLTDETKTKIARALEQPVEEVFGGGERRTGFQRALAAFAADGHEIPRQMDDEVYAAAVAAVAGVQMRDDRFRSPEEWQEIFAEVLSEIWEHLRVSEGEEA